MSDFVYRPIKSDREDGRFLHSDLFMRDWYKRYRPKLEYKDGMSHDDFLVWKEKVRAKLEEIVNKLEEGSLPLDKSMELFEEGTRLSVFCEKCLNEAEQKITELKEVENNG